MQMYVRCMYNVHTTYSILDIIGANRLDNVLLFDLLNGVSHDNAD